MMRPTASLASSVLLLAIVFLVVPTSIHSQSSSTLYDVVTTSPDHRLLAALLQQSPLFVTKLKTESATLFAPNDTAFASLSAPYAFYLHPEWHVHLHIFLMYHIIPKELTKEQIFASTELETIDNNFTISVDPTNQTVNGGASIVTADIEASNGYVHIPSRVLFSSHLKMNCKDFVNILDPTTYIKFIGIFDAAPDVKKNLDQEFEDGITVFITDGPGFAEFSQEELQHYLSSSSAATLLAGYFVANFIIYPTTYFAQPTPILMNNGYTAWLHSSADNATQINNSTMMDTFNAKNGVVNEIDNALHPQRVAGFLNLTATVTGYAFDEFLQVFEAAGLSGFFNVEDVDSLTFFAPIDSAFDKIQALASRLQGPTWSRHWDSVLLYHIINGIVRTSDLKTYADLLISGSRSTVLPTLSNFTITADITDDEKIAVNGATALYSDLKALNGMIHVIDQVLLPPSVTQSIYQQISEFTTLISWIQATGLVHDLNDTAGPLTFLVPNEDAFAVVDDWSIFTMDEKRQVLRNHIFAANIFVDDIIHSNTIIPSDLGNVTVYGGNTFIGGAIIVNADNLASNGVFHVIDRVLVGSVTATGQVQSSLAAASTSSSPPSQLKSLLGRWGVLLSWIFSCTMMILW